MSEVKISCTGSPKYVCGFRKAGGEWCAVSDKTPRSAFNAACRLAVLESGKSSTRCVEVKSSSEGLWGLAKKVGGGLLTAVVVVGGFAGKLFGLPFMVVKPDHFGGEA